MDQSICRLCAGALTNPIFIFSRAELNAEIEEIFGIKITIDDACQFICSFCDSNLTKFYEFYQTVKTAQAQFNKTSIDIEIATVKLEPRFDDFQTNDDFDITQKLEVNVIEPDVIIKAEKEIKYRSTESGLNTVGKSNIEELFLKRSDSESDENEDGSSISDEESHDNSRAKKRRAKYESSEDIDKQISEFYDLRCSGCNNVFPTWYKLRKHAVKKCNVKRPCVNCTKSEQCNHLRLQSRTDLETHIVYHNDPEKLSCKYCARVCFSSKNLSQHQNLHVRKQKGYVRKGRSTPHACPTCGKVFMNKESYDYHVKYAHMTKEERMSCETHICDTCAKTFASKGGLYIHKIRKHGDSTVKFTCELCAERFSNRYDFSVHYKSHFPEDKRVKCPDCDAVLACNKNLYRHQRMLHPNHAPVKCDLCSKEFRSKMLLECHMKRVHVECTYACSVCQKLFKTRNQVQEHELRHNVNDHVYGCDVCPYTNNDIRNMKKHRKNKHPDAPILKQGEIMETFRLKKKFNRQTT